MEEEARPFALVFVDFGMVGRVPDLMGENLRKVLISVTQRDAQKLTEAYDDLGFFLPGADLERITEAQATVLDRIWGRNLLDLTRPDPKEVQELGMEFRDLLFDFPFQVPQDFIYMGRAMGMVSGLVSLLNPDVNPWYQIEKFAEELILKREGQATGLREFGLEAALSLARRLLDGPAQVQRLLAAAESGRLKVQSVPDRELLKRLDRLEKRLGQLAWSVLGGAGLIAAAHILVSRSARKARKIRR